MKIEEVKRIVMEAAGQDASKENIKAMEKCDYLSENVGSDGRNYVWYLDADGHEAAADAETGKLLTKEQIEAILQ